MPDTESKKNFLMFREALTELERLVDVRGSILYNRYGTTAFSEGIVHTLKLLIEFNIGTSESNAIDELERLVQIKEKIVNQCNRTSYDTISWDHVRRFDKIIESKIDFIKNRPISIGGIEPMTALERLAAVGDKYSSRELHDLLASKRLAQPDTASSHKNATVSNQVSGTQVNSKRDLSNQYKNSKAATNFISSSLSWLQDQDNVRAQDDESSTIDGEELTPPSTIISEFPDPNGG